MELNDVAEFKTMDDFYAAEYDDWVVIRDAKHDVWLACESDHGDWWAVRPRGEEDDHLHRYDQDRPVGPLLVETLWFPIKVRRVGV